MCRLATWQVKEVVQCFGDLKGFHLLVDPQEVGKNRGVAFLEYAQPEQTEQASGCNEQTWDAEWMSSHAEWMPLLTPRTHLAILPRTHLAILPRTHLAILPRTHQAILGLNGLEVCGRTLACSRAAVGHKGKSQLSQQLTAMSALSGIRLLILILILYSSSFVFFLFL